MSPREGTSRPKFGRIDPFCLMAVLPVLLVAGILGALVNVWLGVGFAAFAGLILLFDSWANRPLPAPPQRPAPARRPAQAAPVRRPPVRGPRPAGNRAPVRRAGPPPATR
ncbi:hypothetical protein ABJI51_40840 [Amycolatopsis sp. NEAU-NG30]|jgi:hypothetical protein|uniref:Uncharacterized protein n=1 Tax=Amycolatopsis melonis TaxID=3156488 RepID=A0ABV0LVJ9_9PSEU